MSGSVESADSGLARVLSRSTIPSLILATQDGLRGRLLHCAGKSDGKKDDIVEKALYQGHV